MATRIAYLVFLVMIMCQWGCTEPFEIEDRGFESVLVVESTITDEMKTQIVKLTQTSTLDTNTVLIENFAQVDILASDGERYNFAQDSNSGYYLSEEEFRARPNISYTLKIKTQDGRSYSSSESVLTPSVPLDEVYAERINAPSQNMDGVQVLVNALDPTGKAKYFRYEYEETYKIVAPYPSPYTAEIVDYNAFPLSYNIVLRDREPEIVCYSTEYSTGIKQVATTDLNENRVYRFPVKYLSKDDAKMLTRYSILVKQYVQSIESYTFYKILEDLGSVGNILSQGQPGYVVGNIVSDNDEDEKVIGFFEVSSVSSKRIYFNYEDFELEEPPYFVPCEVLPLDYADNTTLDNDPDDRRALVNYIKYFDYQVLSVSSTKIYKIVQPECSVCTYFSSKVKPDFWED